MGKINNEKATLLFHSGAEMSIIDTSFARKVGCVVDESRTQECFGIGESAVEEKASRPTKEYR